MIPDGELPYFHRFMVRWWLLLVVLLVLLEDAAGYLRSWG